MTVQAPPAHWALARGAVRRGALQKPSEFAPFIRWLTRQSPLETVLEIGTARGGSLWAWLQIASPDALVVSVDLPGGLFGGGYTKMQQERIRGYARPGQDLQLIEGDSHDPAITATVRRALDGRTADLVFIDGDHTYQGVRQDWQAYGPMGSIVAFHDIVKHPYMPDCQVDRLWAELRESRSVVEFVDAKDPWGGIGVLVR